MGNLDAELGRNLDAELGAILVAMPAALMADDNERQQYETLLAYCALSIHGGIEWPYSDLLRDMAELPNGFGCWLQTAAEGIDNATITDDSRALWHVALNGARALLQFAHIGRER